MKLPYVVYAEIGGTKAAAIQVLGKDSDGRFTVPVRLIRTAYGRGTMTPKGVFYLGQRDRWHNFNATAASTTHGQYATWFNMNASTGYKLYIHSTLYFSQSVYDRKDVSYKEVGIGGGYTSGCLRMAVADAKWIFDNCPPGTRLEIQFYYKPGFVKGGSTRLLTAPPIPPQLHPGQDPTDPRVTPSGPSCTPTPTPSPTPST